MVKALMFTLALVIVSGNALAATIEKASIVDNIVKLNEDSIALRSPMMSTDDILSAHQQTVNAGIDKLLDSDVNKIKVDIDSSLNSLDYYKKSISALEKRYQEIYSESLRYSLTPEEKARLNTDMQTSSKNIDDLKYHANSIESRIAELRSKLKY